MTRDLPVPPPKVRKPNFGDVRELEAGEKPDVESREGGPMKPVAKKEFPRFLKKKKIAPNLNITRQGHMP